MLGDQLAHHPKSVAFWLSKSQNIDALTMAAEQLFERSSKHVVGQSIWSLIEKNADLERAITTEEDLSIFDHDIRSVFGTTIRGDFHISHRDNGILFWIYQSNRILQRDRTDAALNATKLVSNMAAMLAHEIRNPLGSIRGAAQLLEENMSSNDRELLAVIEEESRRISKLVAEFEDMAGSTPPQIEAVNIHEILDLVKRAAKAGYGRNVTIIDDYDPSLPDVACDRDRMQQVLSNILKNAIEAVVLRFDGQLEKARITITTRYNSEHRQLRGGAPLEISLRDNGFGIPKNIRDDVFKPFVTSKAQGTGLGLSVVARMVEEIGGLIELDTNDDGTEMRLFVPIYMRDM